MSKGESEARGLRVWLPAIRAGSGADVFTQRLADALSRNGHEPLLQWFKHGYEFTPWRLKRVLAPPNIDVVHAGSSQGFAFKREGVPLVITEHHYVLDPAFRPYKTQLQHIYHRSLIAGCLRRSYSAADAITAPSRFTAHVLAKVAGVAATTIPLWAGYDTFLPRTGALELRQSARFRLFFAGNSSKRKGADVVPALASRLGDHFEIRCTGGLRSGGESSEYANIARLGRLSEDDLVKEYQNCDAVLVPSRYEGFGYSALEAMACAKPVVGFRCGAIDEVVVDRETALLSDIDDLGDLAANCGRLARNRWMARKLGIAGRERAMSLFSEAAAVRSYVELYSSLVGNMLRRLHCGQL